MAEFTIKFRPREYTLRERMKNRRFARDKWSKDYGVYWYIQPYEEFNHKLYRKLFYLGNFAPLPVQRKWEPVYNKFMSRHAPYFVRSVYKRWGHEYTGKFF
jgi:hypothetical protein